MRNEPICLHTETKTSPKPQTLGCRMPIFKSSTEVSLSPRPYPDKRYKCAPFKQTQPCAERTSYSDRYSHADFMQFQQYPPHPWVIAGHLLAIIPEVGVCLLCCSHSGHSTHLFVSSPRNSLFEKSSRGLAQGRGLALLDLIDVLLCTTKVV